MKLMVFSLCPHDTKVICVSLREIFCVMPKLPFRLLKHKNISSNLDLNFNMRGKYNLS